MQNGFVESFNGRLRDECLNEHLFDTLKQAREIIEQWRNDYNTKRPHSSLNGLTPTEFAARPNEGQNWNNSPYERGQIGEQVRPPQLLVVKSVGCFRCRWPKSTKSRSLIESSVGLTAGCAKDQAGRQYGSRLVASGVAADHGERQVPGVADIDDRQ